MARDQQPTDTQIVVQWTLPDAGNLKAFFSAEEAISDASGDLYFEDGNDIGQGAFNVFLYSDRVDATIARIVDLRAKNKIPGGFRIGVAVYKNAARTDWTYRAAYPAGLSEFMLNGRHGEEK